MTASFDKTQMSFELPKLSYVDASWEERTITEAEQAEKPSRFANWLAGRIAAFRAWRERDAAMSELAMMTDRELSDIGLTRHDVGRVFTPEFHEDMAGRSA